MPATAGARRPGAVRSEDARTAILAAASELLAVQGYDHLTIEGIAARAKVGKPTIYRWWPSKSALIAECLLDDALLPETITPRNTGDVLADVTEWFGKIVRFVDDGKSTALIRSILAAAIDNNDVAIQLARRLGATPESLEGRLDAAAADGELASDASVRHLSDALIGSIVLRLISHSGFEPDDARQFVRTILRGNLARLT